jgi:hypothetical protein
VGYDARIIWAFNKLIKWLSTESSCPYCHTLWLLIRSFPRTGDVEITFFKTLNISYIIVTTEKIVTSIGIHYESAQVFANTFTKVDRQADC